jgi:hypothetical protein
MALTDKSLAEVTHTRAHRARMQIDKAEAELEAANHTLDVAIPKGDVEEIQQAHICTQKAEQAVTKASHELAVVETLLDAASKGGLSNGTGEGLRTIVEKLRSAP